ncbi:hypothetical protein NDU88_000518 [Pleurodeles waltl]|uniref:Uncharacterized protein n=1 Tax=Pleurodeles waltl TaxID=8319 RepID=A0AAV7Q1H7_PLEWA|nr:hypothetical protein NDU88_000518 [Pleurodeles waltl]
MAGATRGRGRARCRGGGGRQTLGDASAAGPPDSRMGGTTWGFLGPQRPRKAIRQRAGRLGPPGPGAAETPGVARSRGQTPPETQHWCGAVPTWPCDGWCRVIHARGRPGTGQRQTPTMKRSRGGRSGSCDLEGRWGDG